MNKIFKPALCAIAVAWSVSAQAQSEPSVYQNEGRTYVNKTLPVYLQFKTAPDGPAYDLNSEQHPEDGSPLFLDTEGANYIRSHWAVDPATKKPVVPQREVLMEIYADGKAPSTSISLTGAPRHVSGGTTYYGKGLTLSLSANDGYAFDGTSVSSRGVSGVKSTSYTLNGTAATYSSALNMNKEGNQNISYHSTDFVGNEEVPSARQFIVDLTAPTTTISKNGDQSADVFSARSSFTLSPSDALSGVDFTSFTFDGSAAKYGTNVALGSLSDGEHTITWYSTDEVENQESVHTYSFYLDRIAPEASIAIQGDLCEGKYDFISERSKINLTSTDNKAGVQNIEYALGNAAFSPFTSAMTLPNSNGLVTVSFRATDKVNNTSSVYKKTYYLDNEAPNTSISYGTPQFFKQGELFITSQTPVTLTARDNASGVVLTTYAIDGGNENTYGTAFTVPNEGPRTLTFKSKDCVQNTESVKTSRVHVDNSGPNIFHHFSIDPVGKKTIDGKEVNIYPNYTRLYLGATDEKVGNDRIEYSINGERFSAYSDPRTLDISELDKFTSEKIYNVDVRAYDKLGNMSEATFQFAIGK